MIPKFDEDSIEARNRKVQRNLSKRLQQANNVLKTCERNATLARNDGYVKGKNTEKHSKKRNCAKTHATNHIP